MRKIVLAIVLLSVTSSAHAQINRANYRTCSNVVPVCINDNTSKSDAPARCRAAGAECMKTGIFVGPYTGQTFQAEKK
jgi:hypothetical protein